MSSMFSGADLSLPPLTPPAQPLYPPPILRFQLHEQQNKDRPHSDRHRKQHQRRVPERAASRQCIGQKHHGKSGEYSDSKSAFPVHTCSASLSGLAFAISKTAAILYLCPASRSEFSVQ